MYYNWKTYTRLNGKILMKFTTTSIPNVILIEPKVLSDKRGFFFETYRAERFANAGINTNFVQDNHSRSKQGTLRGLHYQIQQAQGKLVRVVSGEIFDVAVDLRKSSVTFGKWVGTYLTGENKHQIWIPAGFAHGFYVVGEWAEVLYKAGDYYAPQWERTLLWNDPTLNIEWPLIDGKALIISKRDAQGLPLSQAELYD
jgi:dTDP-4-dehydrorhamnose 3,5-epimerase